MPHGASWFKFLPGYDNLEAFFQTIWGPTWIKHDLLTIQHVMAAILVLIVVSLLGFSANGQLKSASDGGLVPPAQLTTRNFFEAISEMLYRQMRQIIGAEAKTYFPVIACLAMFVFFSNILGLVPGFSPPTDNWNTTLACGVFVFIYYNFHGLRVNGFAHIGHMMNPVGTWWGWFLMPLLFPIELISHMARPLSLSLRLMGNMIGDHAVLSIITAMVPFIVPLPFFILGLVVCVVQTLVFTLLAMVYISMSVAQHHHEEHESHDHVVAAHGA